MRVRRGGSEPTTRRRRNGTSIADGTSPAPGLLVPHQPATAGAARARPGRRLCNDPPLGTSGMVTVIVDDQRTAGRVRRDAAAARSAVAGAGTTVDWVRSSRPPACATADFAEVPPQWTPQDLRRRARMAWEGPMPERPRRGCRVEAASYRGRPVSFQVVWPWTRPARMDQPRPSAHARASSRCSARVVVLVACSAGAVRARAVQPESGRADRRGAIARGAVPASSSGSRRGRSAPVTSLDRRSGDGLASSWFLAFALLNVGLHLALLPRAGALRPAAVCPDMLIGWTRVAAAGRSAIRGSAATCSSAWRRACCSSLIALRRHDAPLLGAAPVQPRVSIMSPICLVAQHTRVVAAPRAAQRAAERDARRPSPTWCCSRSSAGAGSPPAW